MIRTRNFFFFILLLAFLILGIVLTLWLSAGTKAKNSYTDMLFGTETATRTAEVIVPNSDKPGRLEALRQKLSTFTDVALAPSVTAVPETEEPLVATTTEAKPDKPLVQRCVNYKLASVPQLTGGLTYVETGGQRTFTMAENIASPSTSTPEAVEQQTVFTLPLRSANLGVTECIGTDVVAVTPTGLPIRNTDAAAYSGSGEGTLIGYTIDGLMLFGRTSSIETDICGGATVGGVYRYYLAADRATVLNCFVAIPVAL